MKMMRTFQILAAVHVLAAGSVLCQSSQEPHSQQRMPVTPAPLSQTMPPSPPAGPAITVDQLLRMAEQNNPTLRQAQANVEAARGKLKQAGLYPNPMIGYTGDEISRGPIIRGGEHGFFVDQTIVLGGKLGKARNVFRQAVVQAEAEVEAQRIRVTNTVRRFFFQAMASERRMQLREQLAGLADEVVKTSHGLYNVGQSDRPDVLEAEIEARQLKLQLESARIEHRRIWRQLAAAVGVSELPMSPVTGEFEGLPQISESVVAHILNGSPEIRIAQAALARSQALVTLAKAERVPDIEARGGMMYNRELLELGPRPVGWEGFADVGVRIPIFNRNQGNILAAQSELIVAQQDLRRLEFAIRHRFAEAFSQYETARNIAESYRAELIPRAEQSHQLYLTRFREMTAAYPQVLIARRNLLRLQDDYLAALATAWDAVVPLQGSLLGDGFDTPASFIESMRAEPTRLELKGLNEIESATGRIE